MATARTITKHAPLALLGPKDKALDWLERAAAAGFSDRRLAESDTDLASLRGEAGSKRSSMA